MTVSRASYSVETQPIMRTVVGFSHCRGRGKYLNQKEGRLSMKTKRELIEKLKGRKVKLVSGKYVPANEFNFKYWTKKQVKQHLKASRK